MLAQKDYKKRHGEVCFNTDYNFCKKFGIKITKRWYENRIESIIENHVAKLLWGYGKGNKKVHGK